MPTPEQHLQELGITLPKLPAPVGNFVPFVRQGDLVFLSGQGPILEDGSLATGKVGSDVTADQAYEHSRRVGMVLLSAMREATGSLDRIERVVKLLGMVNAAPDFADHPKVINGCSDLFSEVFADRGQHARSAVGMGSLPGQITVEIEAIVAVRAE
ncbi:MAG: RidA family protein [Rhodospirillales bacterium]|jgi:enamine deaminase RidA (YjgF/YER057c/UK114 family)|nr:RidA family protein [Rhodospirillales bacterium]